MPGDLQIVNVPFPVPRGRRRLSPRLSSRRIIYPAAPASAGRAPPCTATSRHSPPGPSICSSSEAASTASRSRATRRSAAWRSRSSSATISAAAAHSITCARFMADSAICKRSIWRVHASRRANAGRWRESRRYALKPLRVAVPLYRSLARGRLAMRAGFLARSAGGSRSERRSGPVAAPALPGASVARRRDRALPGHAGDRGSPARRCGTTTSRPNPIG